MEDTSWPTQPGAPEGQELMLRASVVFRYSKDGRFNSDWALFPSPTVVWSWWFPTRTDRLGLPASSRRRCITLYLSHFHPFGFGL